MYDEFIRSRDVDILRQYKRTRNKLNSDLKKAKLDFFKKKFESISNHPSKIWNTIRNLVGTSKNSISDSLVIDNVEYSRECLAEKFNNYFLDAGAAPSSNKSCLDCRQYIPSEASHSIFLTPCTELEIYNFLRTLDKNTAAGYDDIKATPIIVVADILSYPLAHICNAAFETGIFPESMKKARVVVIHKGGPLNSIGNYRPISVLPLFSKVVEHLFKTRLATFLNLSQYIVKEQYGFREGKSTEMALLNIKDKLVILKHNSSLWVYF